jgi:hypothetical protein
MSQKTRRARVALATAIGIGLATGAIAEAAPGDVKLTGETADGAKVKLTVAESGNATRFKIAKTKFECNQGGTLSNNAASYSGFDRSDPGSFADKRSSASDTGGYHFETKSKLKGKIADDGVSWSGTLKLATKVFKQGDRVDTCALSTSWDAS